jgi:hypothetical protein
LNGADSIEAHFAAGWHGRRRELMLPRRPRSR